MRFIRPARIRKSRFVEMFGNGQFPALIIGDKFKTQSGGTPSSKKREYYEGGDIPWLTSGEVNLGVIRATKSFITKDGLDNSSAKWTPKGSVLVAMYGATAGKVGLLEVPVTTNQAVCSILPRDGYEPYYLYHAVSAKEQWMISKTAGAAQPNISQGIIRAMEIPDPPLSVQRQFANFILQLDKSEFAIRKRLEKARLLYRAKLQEFFG